MIDFQDGPAKDKILELLRMPMPLFLRVVRDSKGVIDALDQLDDTPAEDEELFAYVKIKDNGTVHIDCRDKKGKRFGRWYNPCTYALHEPQPDQQTMRDSAAWQTWCKDEYAKRTQVPA